MARPLRGFANRFGHLPANSEQRFGYALHQRLDVRFERKHVRVVFALDPGVDVLFIGQGHQILENLSQDSSQRHGGARVLQRLLHAGQVQHLFEQFAGALDTATHGGERWRAAVDMSAASSCCAYSDNAVSGERSSCAASARKRRCRAAARASRNNTPPERAQLGSGDGARYQRVRARLWPRSGTAAR